MSTRRASHAGSWYEEDGVVLGKQLDRWLSQVPDKIERHQLPIPSARVIIAPHAGYSYSGKAAAWAYKSLDLSKAKRIFLLGPSHAWYLVGCALSQFDKLETPLGDLQVDRATVAELHTKAKFEEMTPRQDETEHSMEMHLPYIYKVLSQSFADPKDFPPIVPVLVGNTKPAVEQQFGNILAPYLADPTSVFIISSDFCHWGLRFQYTYYIPGGSANANTYGGKHLTKRDRDPTDPKICDSIDQLDKSSIAAIKTGKHETWIEELKQTGNTVCGRHPIGIVIAAIEVLENQGKTSDGKGKFEFIRYERSSEVEDIQDSSVSYASAYAIL